MLTAAVRARKHKSQLPKDRSSEVTPTGPREPSSCFPAPPLLARVDASHGRVVLIVLDYFADLAARFFFAPLAFAGWPLPA